MEVGALDSSDVTKVVGEFSVDWGSRAFSEGPLADWRDNRPMLIPARSTTRANAIRVLGLGDRRGEDFSGRSLTGGGGGGKEKRSVLSGRVSVTG